MFRKAHLLFTLLCGGSTTAITILMSLLYLRVSENNLYENHFRSFQNDINTITASLEDSASISLQWLERIEAQNDYMIYVTDNGIPFLYNTLRDQVNPFNRDLLNENLAAFHDIHEMSPSGSDILKINGSTYSGIWHAEFRFFSPATKETYYSSLIEIERDGIPSQIVILCPLKALHTQILRQRIHFLLIDCAAVMLLFAFSWFFTGRLIKPLKENHEAQTQFIAAASHELRTPLSVILASSECCETASMEEQKGFFQTIRKEGWRMHDLISDMLTLVHSGTNRFPIERSDVQLDTLCLNAYEAFESLCRGRRLMLHLSLPDEVPPRCCCDADRITQVLSILLHNAVSYTPEGGTVTLSLCYRPSSAQTSFFHQISVQTRLRGTLHTGSNSGCFEITVTDTGIGISDTDKKHIFDRFYRAEKSRSTKGHFGLGLSIAQEIITAHHGKIKVEDNPSGGSIFIVQLPENDV